MESNTTIITQEEAQKNMDKPESKESQLVRFKAIADNLVVSLTDDITEQRIALQEEFPESAIPETLDDKKDYDLVKKAINTIKKPRIALEKNRKEVKAVPFELCKKIDAAAKPERELLEALERPWKEARKDHDEKEEIAKREAIRKEEEIVDRIGELSTLSSKYIASTSQEIGVIMAKLELEHGKGCIWAEGHQADADSAFLHTMESLNGLYEMKDAAEQAERIEKERLEKEQAEKDRIAKENAEKLAAMEEENREAQAAIAKERAEIAEKERKLQSEKDRIEQEKRDAELAQQRKEQEAKDAIIAEKKRIADEKLAKERAEAAEKERIELATKKDKKKARQYSDMLAILNNCEYNTDILDVIISGGCEFIQWTGIK